MLGTFPKIDRLITMNRGIFSSDSGQHPSLKNILTIYGKFTPRSNPPNTTALHVTKYFKLRKISGNIMMKSTLSRHAFIAINTLKMQRNFENTNRKFMEYTVFKRTIPEEHGSSGTVGNAMKCERKTNAW